MPWTFADCRSHLSQYAWLYAVMAVAAGLGLLFFTGFSATDDRDYVWAAHRIAEGENFLVGGSANYELAAVRLSMTLPLALVAWLSDGSVSWMAGFHLLYHLGCVVVAYALGRIAHNEVTGRIAAVLVATCPLLYFFAGLIYPDLPIAMWAGLSMLALLQGLKTFTPRLMFAAGFLNGVAFSCKGTALILVVPAAFSILLLAPSLRRATWLRYGVLFGLGLATCIALELLVLRVVTGKFVSQFHGAYNWDFANWAEKQGVHPVARFGVALQELRDRMPISVVLLFGGTCIYTFRRERNPILPAYFWWCFAFLTIGSFSFKTYLPQPIFARYYTLIIIPAACATAFLLQQGWSAVRQRPSVVRFAPAVLVLLALFSIRFEVKRNHWFGAIRNSAGVRSFSRAFEIVSEKYPEYPIVLSNEATFTLLPMLEPNVPPHVSTASPGQPWGASTRPVPEPPFIFLDWARTTRRSGLSRVPGLEPAKLETEILEIVYPPTGVGFKRLGAAWRLLVGSEPYDVATASNSDEATLIRLVTAKATEAKPKPPPLALVPLFSKSAAVYMGADRAVVRWTRQPPFTVQYFDRHDWQQAPESPFAAIEPPAREVTVTVGAATFREAPLTARVEVLLYGSNAKMIARKALDVRLAREAKTFPVVVTSETPAHSFRVRWWFDGKDAGGLRLDPLLLSTSGTSSKQAL